jgi:acetate kinase
MTDTQNQEIESLLGKIPLFQKFRNDSLERLVQYSTVQDFATGERIIGYGRPGEIFGVILTGSAEVFPGEGATGKRLATLKTGSYFGEMSLLTGEPTTANVQAAEPCRCLLIPQETMSREIPTNVQVLTELARTLSERLTEREEDEDEQAVVESARRNARSKREFRPTSILSVSRILVLNLGSSSLKYDFMDSSQPEIAFRGLVERIGGDAVHRSGRSDGDSKQQVAAPDHEAALRLVLEDLAHPEHGAVTSLDRVTGVGHRVVHGGDRYSASVLIDDDVIAEIKKAGVLAPLHNPVNLKGIELCAELLPNVPQVAVFDTAFHQSMPKHAFLYAIPYELYQKHQLRRYGFHGTSHKYVSMKAAAHLQRSFRKLKLITCHLGNGASIAAIDHGRVIDTTMGLTPLEGLVMGTRSGDVDPGLVLHLCNSLDMAPTEVDRLLNKESGLKGLSGLSNDMRELVDAADEGHPRALLAIQVFCYRIKKYIGSYMAALGGLDALVFTGGIGEHSAWIRSRACQGLVHMGLIVDESKNQEASVATGSAEDVSDPDSPVRILVVPTDEEGMIARETESVLRHQQVAASVNPSEIHIPIGISAHHVHLQPDHVEALFGKGHTLTERSPLAQPGQFACEERVNLVGPKGRVERVRILGPARKQTQVEISRTEEFKLGIDAPIRASGDLAGSPGLVLEGSHGTIDIDEGVICAMRHIHVHPADALRLAVRDKDIVRVRVEGERSLIFGEVLVRISPKYKLEMHVDTDEANAAELDRDATGSIDSLQSRRL